MFSGKTNEIDMTNGPLAGKMLLFAVPLMLSSILQLLFNAADVIVVGRFAGDDSLAAVGSTTNLINLIIQLFMGLSVGANITAARAIGEKQNKDYISRIVSTAVVTALVSGAGLLVFGVATARFFLTLMSSPENVIGLSTLYLRIYFCSMPFMMLYNFGSALLRARGDTKKPLIFLLIAGIINIILNCIFVICFHMDVAGVALATLISQVISGLLILNSLMREKGEFRLNLRQLTFDRNIFKKMMIIGLPAGLQSTLFSLSNVVIQSTINTFGSVQMAGCSASTSISNFIYVSMNAFHQTALTFNSQNMGAAKYNRIDKVMGIGFIYVLITGSVLTFSAYAFGPELLGIYSTSSAVVAAGMIHMRCVNLYNPLCGIMDFMPGVIRGMGFSTLPMIVTLLGSCLLRIVWVMTVFRLSPTIETLYMSYPVSWVLTFSIHLVCFFILRKKIRKRGVNYAR